MNRFDGDTSQCTMLRCRPVGPRAIDGARLVHLGHASSAEELQDLVLSEAGRLAHGVELAAGTTSRRATMSITLRVLTGGRNVALTAPGGRLRLRSEEE